MRCWYTVKCLNTQKQDLQLKQTPRENMTAWNTVIKFEFLANLITTESLTALTFSQAFKSAIYTIKASEKDLKGLSFVSFVFKE